MNQVDSYHDKECNGRFVKLGWYPVIVVVFIIIVVVAVTANFIDNAFKRFFYWSVADPLVLT
jgi:hypothetical protein